MLYLRQSTATQADLLGPFVDDTDGATAETGLTIANTDIRLSKNGGNMAAKNSGGATHDENGWYSYTLDATDTDTVGRLKVSCKVSGALAVFCEYQVLEPAVYDALFADAAVGYLASNDDGSGLTEAGGTGNHLTAVPYNSAWDAQIQSECSDALTAYDPPTYNELLRLVAAIARKDSGAAMDLATEITDINQDFGMGGGTYDLEADSLEAIRDRGDSAWVTATGFSTITTGDIDTRLAAIGLDHLLSASVAGADVADDSIFAKLVSSSATADWDDYVNTTESLQAMRDRGDSAWITATGFMPSSEDGSSFTSIPWNAAWDAEVQSEVADGLTAYNAVATTDLPSNFSDLSITVTTGRVDVASIEGSDATDQIRDAVVDDATRIDASALNTAAAAVGSDGTGLTEAGGDGDHLTEAGGTGDHLTAIPWNANWDAEVQSECTDALNAYDPPTRAELTSDISGLNDLSAADVNTQVDTALSDIHLDHLFAATYDPASKPGAADAFMNELVENDGGVTRFTANALEQGPSGGGDGSGFTAIPWNANWDAEVQSEVQDAIEANHLDHLLAVDYDPSSKPGTSTALLNELVENDGGVSRFTTNALEQGPSGGGGGDSALLQNTTIATLASQTSFTLTAGSADDDAYNGALVIVTDQTTSTQKAVGFVLDYTGATKTVTLLTDPGVFTMATGDTIDVIAVGYSMATAVPATGAGGTVSLVDRRILTNVTKPSPYASGQRPGTPPQIVIDRHNDWSETLQFDIDITGWQTLWITCKDLDDLGDDDDTDAYFQIKAIASPSSSSLTYLNQAPAATSTDGSLTVDDASVAQITATLQNAATTALVASDDRAYEVKWMNAAGDIFRVSEIGSVLISNTITVSTT